MEPQEIWAAVNGRFRSYLCLEWDFEGLSKAIGVTPQTVGKWLTTRPPAGEHLIRLWHFLAAIGYESPEMDHLPAWSIYAGQLLTLSIVTMEELAEIFNVKNPQTVLQILRGQPPMRPSIEYLALTRRYDEELTAAIAALPRASESRAGPPDKPGSRPEEPSGPVLAPGDAPLNGATILSAALPLCRHLLSDDCTPQDRSRFRDLMGSEALFELSNTVNALCSERARKQAR